MKKLILNFENPNGLEVEMTAEEISAKEADQVTLSAKHQDKKDAQTAKDNLKASAKAKLIAGEALTEDEADTIVL